MKRRTAIPGYGKRHQRAQRLASELVRTPGKLEDGLQIERMIRAEVSSNQREIRCRLNTIASLKHFSRAVLVSPDYGVMN